MPHFQLSSGSCNRGEFCALAALWQRGPRCGSVKSVKFVFLCLPPALCVTRSGGPKLLLWRSRLRVRHSTPKLCRIGSSAPAFGTKPCLRPHKVASRFVSRAPVRHMVAPPAHGCRPYTKDSRALHFFAPSIRPGEIAIGWALSNDRIGWWLSDTAAKRARF